MNLGLHILLIKFVYHFYDISFCVLVLSCDTATICLSPMIGDPFAMLKKLLFSFAVCTGSLFYTVLCALFLEHLFISTIFFFVRAFLWSLLSPSGVHDVAVGPKFSDMVENYFSNNCELLMFFCISL